jgi:D-aminopeptidase
MSNTVLLMILCLVVCLQTVAAQTKPGKPRARDLGIPFDGAPGQLNAITDVAGVEVGQVTLISGDGKVVPGKGPVRTGVTAVLTRGKDSTDRSLVRGLR